MDQELKQYLDGKLRGDGCEVREEEFAGIEAKFATKQDLERVETNLLTEFHKWASPADARMKTHTAAIHAIDLEMEALTERVEKLEKRD